MMYGLGVMEIDRKEDLRTSPLVCYNEQEREQHYRRYLLMMHGSMVERGWGRRRSQNY